MLKLFLKKVKRFLPVICRKRETDAQSRKFMISARPVIGFLLLLIVAHGAGPASGAEETPSIHPPASPGVSPAHGEERRQFLIEIRIGPETLVLYEKSGDGEWVPRIQYKVGAAVRGLHVYPLGKGKVTAISFNPWWYPTAYSRQVFRDRGIDLPRAVPPGNPLNYMGAVKISLSHRTAKGAIYRIHGNNNPGRVGKRVTGGCFVMFNEDALDLARRISVGTEVDILP